MIIGEGWIKNVCAGCRDVFYTAKPADRCYFCRTNDSRQEGTDMSEETDNLEWVAHIPLDTALAQESAALARAEAAEARLAGEQWNDDMDAAPQDGTEVLVCDKDGYVNIAYFQPEMDEIGCWGWYSREDDWLSGTLTEPTHWRQMPAPPNRAALTPEAEGRGDG